MLTMNPPGAVSDPPARPYELGDRELLGCPHVPTKWMFKRFDDVDITAGKAVEKAVDAASRLVTMDVGNLLLSGPVGCGKTLIAAATCHDFIESDRRRLKDIERRRETIHQAIAKGGLDPLELSAFRHEDDELSREAYKWRRIVSNNCPYWVDVPMLLGGLKREYSLNASDRPWARQVQQILNHSSAMLVLDDLGVEKASDWTIETLFELVESRYSTGGGQLLITSNRSVDELAAIGYERIVSRVSEDGLLIEMRTAKDYRAKLQRRLEE